MSESEQTWDIGESAKSHEEKPKVRISMTGDEFKRLGKFLSALRPEVLVERDDESLVLRSVNPSNTKFAFVEISSIFLDAVPEEIEFPFVVKIGHLYDKLSGERPTKSESVVLEIGDEVASLKVGDTVKVSGLEVTHNKQTQEKLDVGLDSSNWDVEAKIDADELYSTARLGSKLGSDEWKFEAGERLHILGESPEGSYYTSSPYCEGEGSKAFSMDFIKESISPISDKQSRGVSIQYDTDGVLCLSHRLCRGVSVKTYVAPILSQNGDVVESAPDDIEVGADSLYLAERESFSSFIDYQEGIVENSVWSIGADGSIEASGVDPANVVVFETSLDASSLSVVEPPQEAFEIGVNLGLLQDVLRVVPANDRMRIGFTQDSVFVSSSYWYVRLRGLNKDTVRSINNLPDVDYDVETFINSDVFNAPYSDMDTKTVFFGTVLGKVFIADGQGTWAVLGSSAQNLSLISYTKEFLDVLSIPDSTELSVSFGLMKRLEIEFSDDGISIRYFVAPREFGDEVDPDVSDIPDVVENQGLLDEMTLDEVTGHGGDE